MKFFLKYILIASIFINMLCSCTDSQQINYAILSGVIENADDNTIFLNSRNASLRFDDSKQIEREISLDDKGAFIDTLFINSETFFLGKIDRHAFLFSIKPGEKLSYNVDINNYPASVVYEGDRASIHNYEHLKTQVRGKHNLADRERKFVDEQSYNKIAETEYQEFLNNLTSAKGLSSDYIEQEKKELSYEKIKKHLGYACYYPYYQKESDEDLTDGFLDILSSIDLNNIEEYKSSISYQFMIRAYYKYMFMHNYDVNTTDTFVQLEQINKLIGKHQEMKNEVFFLFAETGITRTNKLQAYYDFFMANVTNTTYQELITNQYKLLIATEPGQPSPEFTNYKNVEGGTNSLSDFRGKYVYIDVWATWCGPCKAEIPYLKEVEQKYHEKNIEFISLSTDSQRNIEKWKKFVKEKELGGVQIIADNEWKSEFVQKFQIKGIPHFILIDPEGKIVDSNAPRPSSPKLIELFNQCGI